MNELDLFVAALAISDAQSRAAFLDHECRGDLALRARIEQLLAGHALPSNPLEIPPSDANPNLTIDAATIPPRTEAEKLALANATRMVIAGRYELVEKIGEGGMGEVWIANQSEPVKRKVALKLIKAGMDSKAVLARFEQERQALAVMDHPNIARVFDGGVTAAGHPFFVMELVEGMALNRYCDGNRLTPRERLELFVPICQAVQHAHQKGIVHRDLKPSNILVTVIDDKPIPKVIDFGVAKATGAKLVDESMATQIGAVIGTLEYMSPEQASGEQDIDTRADIYSLGVILYELLTGLRPIDAPRLRKAALLEMVMIIVEEEPSRPSTRLSTADALPSLAAVRRTDPKKLTAMLRGELDWVIMKCLEKKRDRRYETANGLLRDIQRFLADEAVEARPPSAGYRMGKFLRRHKGPVIGGGLLLLTLVAGIVGTSYGLVRAEQRHNDAVKAAEAEKGAKIEAQEQQKKAEFEKQIALAVKDFLQNKLLAQTDLKLQHQALMKLSGKRPDDKAKRNPTIRDLLDRAAWELSEARIESSFPGQPLLQAEILHTVGQAYSAVHERDLALGFLRRSLALRAQHLGPNHPESLVSLTSVGECSPITDSKSILEDVVMRSQATLGPAHPDTLKRMSLLGCKQYEPGTTQGAQLLDDAFRLSKATLGPDHPDTLDRMVELGGCFAMAYKLEEGLPLLEEALKRSKEHLGLDHPNTLDQMSGLGLIYAWRAGRADMGALMLEEALERMRATLGPDHPSTRETIDSLVLTYQHAGKRDRALPLLEDRLRYQKAQFADHDPDTLKTLNQLIDYHLGALNYDKAFALQNELLRITRAKRGPDHPETLALMSKFANGHVMIGKAALAVPLYEAMLKLQKVNLGPDHSDTLKTMDSLARSYASAGKPDLAVQTSEEMLKLAKAKHGPDDPVTLNGMRSHASVYQSVGKLDQAVQLLQETLKLQQSKLGPDHTDTLYSMAALADAYRAAGKIDLAIPLCEQVLKGLTTHRRPTLFFTHDGAMRQTIALGVMHELSELYGQTGEKTKAIALLLELTAYWKKMALPGSTNLALMLARYGYAALRLRAFAEAEPILRECLTIREKNEPDQWQTFSTQSMLGEALLGQKKYAEAELLLLKGYEGMRAREKTIPTTGGAERFLREAIERLVQFYEAQDKKEDAAKWKKELEAVKSAEKQPMSKP
jgi:tetratricopeptide (TPR) repeat protein/tRNA A-37 threonylcarbamoyl transferase component Bud32